MIRRVAFALAVITATVFWADCSFCPSCGSGCPCPPASNTLFDGCFEGPVTDPSGFGEVRVILEAKTEDEVMLGGCVLVSPALGSPVNGMLAGMVLDERRQARVTVPPTSVGQPTFTLLVERSPAEDVVAATVNLTNHGSAPFDSAINLQPCQPVLTCPSQSIRMPFLPGGGAQ